METKFGKTLYISSNTKIKQVISPANQKEQIAKIVSVYSTEEENKILFEAESQQRFSHKNLVKVINFFKRKGKVVIIMKRYRKGDLACEIARRNKEVPKAFWPENELLEHFGQLVQACAFLQKNGFSHRDLKPQNILISDRDLLKITDFGAIKQNVHYINDKEASSSSIQGTALYLSPLLRDGFRRFYQDITQNQVIHNCIKSDVYSLGMTFVAICNLQEPFELMTLNGLAAKIHGIVRRIQYSDTVKTVILRMLIIDEKQRPDFKQLAEEYFPENRLSDLEISFSRYSLFKHQIKHNNKKNAVECLRDLMKRNLKVNLLFGADRNQIDGLIKGLLKKPENTTKDLRLAHFISQSVGKIHVHLSRLCYICSTACEDIGIFCCRIYYMHSRCFENGMKIDYLPEQLYCIYCHSIITHCNVCKNYFPETNVNELPCLHTRCNTCESSKLNPECTVCIEFDGVVTTSYLFYV